MRVLPNCTAVLRSYRVVLLCSEVTSLTFFFLFLLYVCGKLGKHGKNIYAVEGVEKISVYF